MAKTIHAESTGVEIEDGGETKGLTTVNFSWPVNDGGLEISRSPIVGWAYSFSLNNPALAPANSVADHFVAGSSVTLRLEEAVGGPEIPHSTATYTFKVIGLDKAGNWQSTPTVFTYNFKFDSTPAKFKGISLEGVKMPKEGMIYSAVPTDAKIHFDFSEPMNFSTSTGGIQFIQTHNSSGRLSVPLAVAFSPSEEPSTSTTTTTMTIQADALEPGARYEIHSSTWNLFDLGGNRLPVDQKFDIVFFTQLDPSLPGVFETAKDQARVEIAAGALGSGPSGVAFDGSVKTDPSPVGQMVRRANGLVSKQTGGAFKKVLDVVEYNRYGADGKLLKSPFLGRVTLKFKYQDVNGDGIEDRSEAGRPVKVDKLAIYTLDEETGIWMRLPGGRVDALNKEVTVDLRHFSSYALIGEGDFDLKDAHVFPVPFRAAKDPFITFVFPNAQAATVKIFTLDGKLVKTLSDSSSAGQVRWDPVSNESGEPVGSDVYLYVIENEQQRKVGKLMVIR